MRFLISVLVVLGLVGCDTNNADPSAEAQAALESYVAAINDGDIEAAVAMYDDKPGFHWVEQGGVQYESAQQSAASLEGVFAGGGSARMTIDNIRVAPMSPESALVSGHFDMTMLDAAGAEHFAFDGWMTVGMVKRADGWKIIGGQTGPGRDAE